MNPNPYDQYRQNKILTANMMKEEPKKFFDSFLNKDNSELLFFGNKNNRLNIFFICKPYYIVVIKMF